MSCSCFACFKRQKTIFSYGPLDVQHGTSWQRTLWGLENYNCGYKKFSNSLELSYSTVARVIQRFFKTGFTRNRPRKGQSKILSPCAVRQLQKLASKNRIMSAASIALEVAEVEGQLVSAQTTHSNKSVCMAVVPEGSLFWSWLTKKSENSLLKTTSPRAWITGTMSCGLTSLR